MDALLVTAMAGLCLAIGSVHASLIAYYPFDNNFADSSGNANDLVVAVGSPSITTTAGEHKYGGGALDADSTTGNQEYLNLTSPITFGAGDAWSVAFWARRRPGADFRQGMVIGNPGNRNDFIWVPDNPSQVQGLRFRNSGGADTNYDGFPDDGQFHHWAVIADGAGNVQAYRNNVPLSSFTRTTTFSITSVAHAYNATTQSMNGQIDELYIYNEAIDAATVNNLFTGIPEPGSLALIILGGLMVWRRRR